MTEDYYTNTTMDGYGQYITVEYPDGMDSFSYEEYLMDLDMIPYKKKQDIFDKSLFEIEE